MGSLDFSPTAEEQTYPSIGDRLEAASLSWAWYNEGWNTVKPWALKTAFDARDGSVVVDSSEGYLPHHNPFQFFQTWVQNVKAGHARCRGFSRDVKNGKLPAVSFLKGTGSSDEHPAYSAPRWGEQWVMGLLEALGESSAWERLPWSSPMTKAEDLGIMWRHRSPARTAAVPAFRRC